MTTGDRTAMTLVALAIAVAGARQYAGSWNDGSHLAAAESLVDRGTFAIDRSIFVEVPDGRSPYDPADAALARSGTLDRVYIDGHFYSDKPPAVGMLLGGLYAVLQSSLGIHAAANPRRYCWWLALGSSGLAYVVSVWSIFGIGVRIGLPRARRALLAGSFAMSTIALAYSRAVNQHELLLAVAAVMFLVLSQDARTTSTSRGTWLCLGALAGLAYALDLGAGPLLLAATLGLVWYRTRRLASVAMCLAAALPAVALHHWLTWSIGGTLLPLNSLERLEWPGSPFDAGNVTGRLHHSPGGVFVYAADLLLGKKGFLLHNLPLLLLGPALRSVWRRGQPARAEITAALAWGAATWLAYSLLSNNYSGGAVSIRWFVPLLAPAYFMLAMLLREQPERIAEFLLLSGAGVVLAAIAWWRGPWTLRMLPFYWPIVAVSAVGWLALRWRHDRRASA